MVAIYCRVSTKEQAENGNSIDEQRDRLIQFCKARGWEEYEVYIDAGVSGAKEERPALSRVIDGVRDGSVSTVLVYKLDRLARSQRIIMDLIENEFIPRGVAFVSATESFDTSTPFGMAMVGMLSVFAQLEREQIKERMKMGKYAGAKKGKWTGGHPPFGYDLKNGSLVINEKEAEAVRFVYRAYAQGQSLSSIATYVTDVDMFGDGIVRGVTSFYTMLENPLYIGKQRFKGEIYDCEVPPIMDEKLWNAVQQVRATRPRKKHTKNPWLLSNLLVCSKCGAHYISVTQNINHFYYCCASRNSYLYRRRHGYCNTNKNWKRDELEAIVVGEIKKLVFDKDLIPNSKPVEMSTEPLLQRIADIDKEQERLVELFTIGSLDKDKIKNKADALQKEKLNLQAQITSLENRPNTFYENLETFGQVCETATTEQLSTLIHLLIDKIVIDGEDVNIYWNL